MKQTVISRLHASVWSELADNFGRTPTTLSEATTQLFLMRVLAEHALVHVQASVSADCSFPQDPQMVRLLGAHLDLLQSIDATLKKVRSARGIKPAELWKYFRGRFRETAVRAVEIIADVVKELDEHDMGFAALPPRRRDEALVAMAGYTPLGAVLARTAAFQDAIGALFDHKHVRRARRHDGPKAGAKQLLALYTQTSPKTVTRRIRDLRANRVAPVGKDRARNKRKRPSDDSG